MRLYVENGTNYIKSLDDGSPIKLQVIDNDNSPVDLTTFNKVTVKVGNENGTILNITPDSLDLDGFVSFKLPKNTLTVGKYQIEVYMYGLDETIRVAPSDSILPFSVFKALDEVGTLVNVMALDEILAKVNETVISSNEAVKLANNSMVVSDIANTKSTEANTKSDKAVLDSTTAVTKADEANMKSDEAIVIANSTIAKSDKAVLDSTNAVATSNEANTKSDKAIVDSAVALTKATESVTTANGANTKSDKAITDSATALTAANEAKTTSEQANTKSDNAVSTSNEANTKSDKAITDSANAVTVSNQANAKSDNAVTVATQSDVKSTNAETVALDVESRFNELVSGNTSAEVIEARGTFTTLSERLNDSDTKLGKKYEKSTSGIPLSDLATEVKTAIEEGGKVKSVNGNLPNQQGDITVDLTSYAKTTEVDSKLEGKVSVEVGKGLSTNDFTNEDKTNLDNLKLEITTHKADNVSHDTYVTCATASAIAEKVVTANGFSLVEGARITVKFANANTATTPTLKINTEDAKPLVKADGTAFKSIKAGIYSFVYDGSGFIVQGEGGDLTDTDLTELRNNITGILGS